MSRRHRLALGGVLLLAFVLRAGWVWVARLDPSEHDVYDMAFYHITAVQLAAGNGYTRLDGAPTAVWPPGYPALLATVYAASGGSVLAAQLANAALGALATFFTWGIAARLFGAAAGLVAALLLALCPDDVFYTSFLLSEPAFGALFGGLVWLFVVLQQRRPPPRPWAWWVLGAWAGLATLTRGIALAWLAVPILVWWREQRGAGGGEPAAVRLLPRAALAVAGLLCVVLPWSLRNTVQLGAPVLLASSLGRTLAHAHGPFETGDASLKAFVWRQQVAREYAGLPYPEQEVALDRAFRRLSLEHVVKHPGAELAVLPQRLLHLFGHGHRALEIGRPRLASGERQPIFGPSRQAWLAGSADVAFYALLVLGLLGLPRCFATARGAGLVIPLSLAYFTLLHVVVFPGDPRYHVPMLPLLAVSAGALLAGARTSREEAPPVTR